MRVGSSAPLAGRRRGRVHAELVDEARERHVEGPRDLPERVLENALVVAVLEALDGLTRQAGAFGEFSAVETA